MEANFKKELEKVTLTTVRKLLQKAWVVATSGYACFDIKDSSSLDGTSEFQLVNTYGLIITNQKDGLEKVLKWEFSTFGFGKLLRDQTYRCIKNSLYPSMKIFAQKGDYEFQLTFNNWLVNSDRLLLCGLDYFVRDGFECILKDGYIVGFSWKLSYHGFAYKLRQFADLGGLNVYLPYLKSNFEKNNNQSIEVSDDVLKKLTPFMIDYLKKKENIYFNC